MYARAFLKAGWNERHLQNFRQELAEGADCRRIRIRNFDCRISAIPDGLQMGLGPNHVTVSRPV